MLKRVLRFRAIVSAREPDGLAEVEYICRGLPILLSATAGLRQFCYFSRHSNGEDGERHAVWLVCKSRRGKCAQLEDAGRAALAEAVAVGAASDYRIERETDESALAEHVKGVQGVPRPVSYETCWRYLDAATGVALEVLRDRSAEVGPTLVGRAPWGPELKLQVGYHLAHFLWNALGLGETDVRKG